ncbi:hypothetical protein CPB85DRAFT_1255119 [Mucidula mucida]|nr:hypothetical protein CPB85DRAFT_1255119 [Mucidula mucida]
MKEKVSRGLVAAVFWEREWEHRWRLLWLGLVLDPIRATQMQMPAPRKAQYSVQIIQLVECTPPPPRRASSFASSGSSPYTSSSEDDDESLYDEMEEYCSSDEDEDGPELADAAEGLRMKRILAWRENFSSTFLGDLSSPCTLKRKPDTADCHITLSAPSSKRPRSQTSHTSSTLSALSCPACDGFFDTHDGLREHAQSEACAVAVQYAFEP